MTIEHQEIKKILRQRIPFLLVDRIVEIDDERAVGIKNVTGTEPYLAGHFPDEPILPGVLLLEAMSQVGGILLAHDRRYQDKTRGYLAEVAKVKFKKFVIPGDQVVMEARKIAMLASVARVEVRSTVAGVEVASGEISYAFA
jgi:3-hydroxyacyl-[acyl-carrier-protein] dehydratase